MNTDNCPYESCTNDHSPISSGRGVAGSPHTQLPTAFLFSTQPYHIAILSALLFPLLLTQLHYIAILSSLFPLLLSLITTTTSPSSPFTTPEPVGQFTAIKQPGPSTTVPPSTMMDPTSDPLVTAICQLLETHRPTGGQHQMVTLARVGLCRAGCGVWLL